MTIHLRSVLPRPSSNLPGPRCGEHPATYPRKPETSRLCGPYSVLLRAGFSVPSASLRPRWALTPPFHPYPACARRFVFCGTFPRVAPAGR